MSEFNELKSNYDSTNARLNEINELYEEILKTKEKENNTIINLEKTNKVSIVPIILGFNEEIKKH